MKWCLKSNIYYPSNRKQPEIYIFIGSSLKYIFLDTIYTICPSSYIIYNHITKTNKTKKTTLKNKEQALIKSLGN